VGKPFFVTSKQQNKPLFGMAEAGVYHMQMMNTFNHLLHEI